MRKEFKVLIFVFILNLLFSQIIGDDNISRVILANKISTNQTIFLDEFRDVFAGDITESNLHYISTKSPGISFSFSLFSYIIDRIFPDSKELSFIKEELRFRKLSISNLPISIRVQSLLALILFSILPGAILILFLNKYTKNIYIAMLLYLSSLLFPYSTTLFSYTFSIFLVIFAFVKRHKILTPILLGLSVFFEFTSIFLAFILLFYLKRKINVYYFLIGVLPSMIYFLVFNDAFTYLFGLSYINYHYYSFVSKPASGYTSGLSLFFSIIYNLFKNSIFIIFSLYRGIFIYFPLLFLFFVYYRNFNIDARKIALFSFFVYLIFNSLLSYWWGSLSFGARNMIFSIPFIVLAISSNWRAINKKVFYALILLSIFINISSFTYWEGAKEVVIGGKEVYITGIYKQGELALENENKLILTFPLLQHYFYSLAENGPRSKLIESLFTDRPLDLRYLLPEDRDYFTSIYSYPPYLSLMILIFLSFIFFYCEIRKTRIVFYSLLILLLTIFVYDLYYFGIFDSLKNTNRTDLKFGFYPKDSSGNIFVYKKGIVYIFSNNSDDKVISINLRAFYEDRRVTLIFNNQKIGDFDINSSYDIRISFPSYIKKGKNVLEILSDNCIRPIELNISNDKRCISLVFNYIDISDLNKKEPVFVEGFFIQNKSSIYSGKYGKIYIYSDNNNPVIISIYASSFLKDRNVSFYLNSQLIGNSMIFKEGSKVDLVSNFTKGWNTLEINSEDCSIPTEEDKRCISIGIFNISIKPLDELNNYIIFSTGWYIPENESYWMGVKANLNIFSPSELGIPNLLVFEAKSFEEDRNVKIYLNRDQIANLTINKDFEKIFSVPLNLSKGINNVTIISDKCLRPKDLGYDNDTRCISISLRSFKILNMSEEKPVLSEVLFPQDDNVKWISKSSKIYIYSSNEKKYLLFVNMTSFLKDREVSFYLNSDLIEKSYVFKEGEEIYLPLKLKSGLNTLEIQSKDCSIPTEEDKRCLSVAIYNISLISLDQLENKLIFSKGWYYKTMEDDYRWGSNFSELLYISPQDAIFTFYFDILPLYNETTIVEFYLNGELKNIFEIARGGGWVYTLPQKINKGINYLEFKVPRGCVVIDNLLHNGDKRCIAMTLRGIKVEK